MSKQLVDLQELAKDDISNDDLMLIRDVSESRDKKAPIGTVIGRPREGWIAVVSDVWTFVSFNADSNVGVVNCNSGALAIYSIGMRVKLVQGSTTKYAVIVGQTDTTLSLYMLNEVALANATIEQVQYSQSFAPQTDTGVNFFATLMTGQIDGLPVIMAVKNTEADPDVSPQAGFVILEAILGDEV